MINLIIQRTCQSETGALFPLFIQFFLIKEHVEPLIHLETDLFELADRLKAVLAVECNADGVFLGDEGENIDYPALFCGFLNLGEQTAADPVRHTGIIEINRKIRREAIRRPLVVFVKIGVADDLAVLLGDKIGVIRRDALNTLGKLSLGERLLLKGPVLLII